MILDYFDRVYEAVVLIQYTMNNIYTKLVVGFILVLGSLALWRFWRFTISPLLRPFEPLELPYWIPCKSIHPYCRS